jgi:hypothetical protein
MGILVNGDEPVRNNVTFDTGLGGVGGKPLTGTRDGASGIQRDVFVPAPRRIVPTR